MRELHVPEFADMTSRHIAICLQQLGMERHIQQFLDEKVDGLVLLNIQVDDLVRDFRMSRPDAIRLVKFAKQGWTN